MPTVELDAKLSKSAVCPAGKDREIFWDATMPGFGLVVTANGARSYVVQYRTADGFSRRMKITGSNLAAAKREAKIALGAVADKRDPLGEKRKSRDARANTLRWVVENEYLENSDIRKLRSYDEIRGTLARYILPKLGSRPIAEIRRREIVRLLGRVKENNGTGAANNAYKVLRRVLAWYAARDDDYTSPVVTGMYTITMGEGARTLTDDEIRILWNVAKEGRGAYDHFLRFTLLTATRLRESASMSRAELSPDGTEWAIPASRYKGQDKKSAHTHLIPLSTLARDVLAGVPVLQVRGKDSPWIFTSDGTGPIKGFSNLKTAFTDRLRTALKEEGQDTHKRIVADLIARYPDNDSYHEPFGKGWSPHSLRKTARTLLSRVGIDDKIAEKCLGHVERGLIGTYNHHEFAREKAEAFEALAREVERVVSGKSAKVISLARV
jgi:diadenosine tetraphosphate (Ap4A) HIT family hydrolase